MRMRRGTQDIYVASSQRVSQVFLSLCTLYHYLYVSMLSAALGLLPVAGGALFMTARVSRVLGETALGTARRYMTRGMRVLLGVLCGLMLLCMFALLGLYPAVWRSEDAWMLFAVVLLIDVRSGMARRLTARRMRRTFGGRAYGVLMAALYALTPGVMAWILTSNAQVADAWQMWGGFVAGAALEAYSIWRERELLAMEGAPDDITPESVRQMNEELRKANAYSAYERLHALVLVALQLTLVMTYTLIGLNAQALLWCMLLAAGCVLVMREVTALCMRGGRKQLCMQMLGAGMALWLCGLLLLNGQARTGAGFGRLYATLCLCVCGLTVSVTALAELERRMTDVAKFQLKTEMRGYAAMRAVRTDVALLAGQMAALILLTALCLPAGMAAQDAAQVTPVFRPMLIVPAVVLVLAATLSTLRFPINDRSFQKLAHWLTLEAEGRDNPALRACLDRVVIRPHKNRFGVRLIIWLLRPLYYHRVLGRENLAEYEDGSMILLCNHGEIYGPVAANLFVPIRFRPWVLSRMMNEEEIVEHMYEGTFMRQKWLPEKWKRPIIRMITPLFGWLFTSLDAIPVYRGQPRDLLKTFRETINAMQAGDNILIFPENGENREAGQRGYAAQGVGDLYTGFAMIAPMYYAKTKKRAVFVPVYASRRDRTLSIGKGIEYDPTRNANEEKLRIVAALHSAMNAMYEKEEAEG